MVDFNEFKVALDQHFSKMSEHDLFRVDVSKDDIWETYLASFPSGSNPIFKERTEHDCQCCKQFIRAAGNTVAIIDNNVISIWDVNVGSPYKEVSAALSTLVKSKKISNVFLSPESHLGTDHNHQMTESGKSIRWDHFHYKLPSKFVKKGKDIATILSEYKGSKDVFKRSLDEINTESISTVLELIEQKSIYRGEEHKSVVELLLKHKKEYVEVTTETKDNYCWLTSFKLGHVSRFRNTVIGTLLADISDGVDLDKAVKSFESKVAPTNYKRPTALVTKGMIEKAQKEIEDLGFNDSLQRRYAVTDDITINNVLYADRSIKKAMNVFEEMAEETPDKIKNMDKVENVDIDTFINDILPKSSSLEILVENRHENNLMSLIAPINKESKNMFKWDNNFSWAYNGETADSIKERVKQAGGNVEGDLRCSLSWFNRDDLDIHIVEPDGNEIYYSAKVSRKSGATLDVDMNAGGAESRSAVENITWASKDKIQVGVHKLFIRNYQLRENIDFGFDVEIEFEGVINSFHYDKKVIGNVMVAIFEYSEENGIKFLESLPAAQAMKEMWGISTQTFKKVSMIMNSPNHWDGNQTGNKHLFFILDNCFNGNKSRGFFNEFLNNGLIKHRKVFEILGSKMKADESEDQLSGLGFSSTQRNNVVCKVTGSFQRTININF